jgi:hypothetical protein
MPLDFISAPKRLPLFWLFCGLTVAFFAVFNWLDQSLRTSAAPSGIVSYELASSPEAANATLASWSESARLDVAFGFGPRWEKPWGGGGAFLATGFDAVENISLFHILLNGALSPAPQLAFWCASIKFALLLAGLVDALLGWLFRQK